MQPCFRLLILAILLCSPLPAAAQSDVKIAFVIGPDVPPSARRQLTNVFAQARRYYREEHGITLKRDVTVLASRSLDNLATIMAETSRGPLTVDQARSILKQRCENAEIGGLQLTGTIAVCLPRRSKGALALNRAHIFGLKKLAVHELAHEIQAQIGNHAYAGESTTEYAKKLGPFWLVEGNAMAFEFDFQAPEISHERWLELLLKERALYKSELDGLTLPGTVKSRGDYLTSALAVQLALEGRSIEVIFDYWSLLGEGIKAEDAFARAYGRKIEDVEAAMQKLLRF